MRMGATVRWVFFQAAVLGFCDSDGHVEPAVSVRPRLKTHGSNNSLYVCPVVEDETDDEVMEARRNRQKRADQ